MPLKRVRGRALVPARGRRARARTTATSSTRRREHPGRAGDVAARLRAPAPGRTRGPPAGALLLKLGAASPFVAIERERWRGLGPPATAARLRRARRAQRPGRARRAGRRSTRSTCRSRGCWSCGSRRGAAFSRGAGRLPARAAAPRAVPDRARRAAWRWASRTAARLIVRAAAAAAAGLAGRARDHRRLPAAQRDADRARHPRAQGLPGELRPARAAALRGRPQERRGGGPRAACTRTCATTSSRTRRSWCSAPDVVVLEGVNVLQRGSGRVYVSDFVDFALYLDARGGRRPPLVPGALPRAAQRRLPAPRSPTSTATRASDEEAVAVADGIWQRTNRPTCSTTSPHAPARGPHPGEGRGPLRAPPAAARAT